MSSTKLLFFDIDDTLIPEGGVYPEGTLEALYAARDNGHKLFINTGRVFCNVEDHIMRDCFSGAVCGCGTHVVYEGNELFYKGLDKDLCYDIAMLCRDCHMYGLFEYKDYCCYDGFLPETADNPLIDFFRKMGRRMVTDIDSPEFIFDKFSIWYDDTSDTERFKEGTKQYFDLIIREEGTFYEMQPKGFSKARGMQFLLDYFGCDREDVYAFGDSNNDIEMLDFAGTGIAMGNATETLKSVADYVTSDILRDGITNAMKHFELI